MADEENRSDDPDADAEEDSGLDEESLRLVKEGIKRRRNLQKRLADL